MVERIEERRAGRRGRKQVRRQLQGVSIATDEGEASLSQVTGA